jgi:type VI secretion system Hcp family effector
MAQQARAFIETFTGIDMHCTVKGHDKHLRVMSFDYGIDIPTRDGVAAGQRCHHPLTLTFNADVETPMLMDALTKNSNIAEITIKFYRHQQAKWDVYAIWTFKQCRAESMHMSYSENDGLETKHVTATFVYGQIDVEVAKKKYADQVFDLSTRQLSSCFSNKSGVGFACAAFGV